MKEDKEKIRGQEILADKDQIEKYQQMNNNRDE